MYYIKFYISQAAIPLYYNGTMYTFLKDSFQEGVILIRKSLYFNVIWFLDQEN